MSTRDSEHAGTVRTAPLAPAEAEAIAAAEAEAREEHIATRAELTAEEKQAGSDDPAAQAAAILAESEARAVERELAPTTAGEHRTSDDAAGV